MQERLRRRVGEQEVQGSTPRDFSNLWLLLLHFTIEITGPKNLRGNILRRQLLSSSLLILVYHRPLRLILLYWLFVYKHPWLYPVVIESGSHFSLKASIFFIRGSMQLFLDLLEFSHQVELGLRASQIEHSVLVGRRNHPAQATLWLDLSLDWSRKTLCMWSQHTRWTDVTRDPIWWKLPPSAHRDRIHLFLFALFRLDFDRTLLFFSRREIQKGIQEFFVRDF